MENKNITIRKASESDHEAILKIAVDLAEWFDHDALTRAIPTDLQIHKIIVAEIENNIVGFITYSSYEGHVFMSWLGVNKDLHNQGIGTKLVEYLENELLNIGINKLTVETLSEATEYEPYIKTRAFYQKRGFIKGESKTIINGDGEKLELVIFHKELKKD